MEPLSLGGILSPFSKVYVYSAEKNVNKNPWTFGAVVQWLKS